MNWATYGSFLGFALILVIIPGPDFTVVTKNTLAGGRTRGLWCAAGVTTSNALQGTIAAAGLGVIITQIEPLFLAVKWAGIGYLAILAVQAFRSAWRGQYLATLEAGDVRLGAWRSWRQGFVCNITNPKVLVFYLAVLPQFLGRDAAVFTLSLYALSHALLSLLYLGLAAIAVHAVRRALAARRVRRWLDVATGTALLGFATKLAIDHD